MLYLRRLGYVFGVSLVIVCLLAGSALGGVNAGATIELSSTISAGTPYGVWEISIQARNLAEVNGYHIAVEYDSEGLEFVNFAENSTFSKYLVFGPYFNRSPNTMDITVCNLTLAATSSESEHLGVLTFKILDSEKISASVVGFHLADSKWKAEALVGPDLGKTSGIRIPVPTYRNWLGNASPNPGNPTITLKYELAIPADVVIAVYSVSGRRIATLVSGLVSAGAREVTWDGRNDSGREVASGTYLVSMITDQFQATRKVVLLR